MLADVKRELSSALGILDDNEGVSQRATYLVDPEGIIRFVYVADLNVGRNPNESAVIAKTVSRRTCVTRTLREDGSE